MQLRIFASILILVSVGTVFAEEQIATMTDYSVETTAWGSQRARSAGSSVTPWGSVITTGPGATTTPWGSTRYAAPGAAVTPWGSVQSGTDLGSLIGLCPGQCGGIANSAYFGQCVANAEGLQSYQSAGGTIYTPRGYSSPGASGNNVGRLLPLLLLLK